MSNLSQIRAREANFHTCQITDWLDGFPLIATPGSGGVIAGSANVGQGSLAIASVDAGADLSGVQVVTVTSVASGLTYLSVADAYDTITGKGVVGLPIYAAGVTFTLNQVVGQPALAVGDSFAIATMPVPVDLTGLAFSLDARQSAGAASVALAATTVGSGVAPATMVSGGATGTLAMRVPQATMAKAPPSAPTYPYNVIATDLATGQRVTAFYGVITHQAVLQPGT